MFEPAPAHRRRPMFAVSAAAHAVLAVALVVPPLLATPEPPELDGYVHIAHVPVLTGDAPVRIPVDSPGRVRESGPGPRAARASDAGARPPARPAVTQPNGIASVLPDPTGDPDDTFTFEESGERSEPSHPGGGRGGGAAGDVVVTFSLRNL